MFVHVACIDLYFNGAFKHVRFCCANRSYDSEFGFYARYWSTRLHPGDPSVYIGDPYVYIGDPNVYLGTPKVGPKVEGRG